MYYHKRNGFYYSGATVRAMRSGWAPHTGAKQNAKGYVMKESCGRMVVCRDKSKDAAANL